MAKIVNEGPMWVPVSSTQQWIPPGINQVLFVRGNMRLEVPVGDGPALITSGFGAGYKEISRPENRPLTSWDRAESVKMDVPILLDGLATGADQTPNLNRILQLGRLDGGSTQPEPFRVWGNHLPLKGWRWVMESTPDFGDVERGRGGRLLRQWLTVHLMQYTNPDQIKIRRVKRKQKKFEKVRKGESVNKLSARLYKGRSKRYVRVMAARIAKLNKVRDRNKVLKTGRKLKLPTNTTVKKADGKK